MKTHSKKQGERVGDIIQEEGKDHPTWILYCTTFVCPAFASLSLFLSLPRQSFLLKMWLQVYIEQGAQGKKVPGASTFLFY